MRSGRLARTGRWHGVAVVALALMFIVTASSKALSLAPPVPESQHGHRHGTQPVADPLVTTLRSPGPQVALVAVELGLAALLLSRRARRWGLRGAAAFCAVGLLVLGRLARSGLPTDACGCFGAVHVDTVTHALLLTGALMLSLGALALDPPTR